MTDYGEYIEPSAQSAASAEPSGQKAEATAQSAGAGTSSAPASTPPSTPPSASRASVEYIDHAYESAGALTFGIPLLIAGIVMWVYGQQLYLESVTVFEIESLTRGAGVYYTPERPDIVGWGLVLGGLGLILTVLGVYRLATHVDYLAKRARRADTAAGDR